VDRRLLADVRALPDVGLACVAVDGNADVRRRVAVGPADDFGEPGDATLGDECVAEDRQVLEGRPGFGGDPVGVGGHKRCDCRGGRTVRRAYRPDP